MDVTDKIDLFLNEIMKKVIRKGKVVKKTICPTAAMKAVGGKCVMMSPQERRNRAKAAKITGKKIKANPGLQKKATKKRAKSMRKRAMGIPDKGAPSLDTTTGEKI